LLVKGLVGVVGDTGTLGGVEEIVLVPGHAEHLSTERVDGDCRVADHSVLYLPVFVALSVGCLLGCRFFPCPGGERKANAGRASKWVKERRSLEGRLRTGPGGAGRGNTTRLAIV
jgi:hypothetical protein